LSRKDLLRGLLVCAAAISLDQASKALVVSEIARGEHVEVVSFLDLTHSRNSGVAFGFAEGVSPAIIGAALVLLIGLIAYLGARTTSGWAVWLGGGLLIGGAVSNLIDRVSRESVVDFIDFSFWPTFNLADVWIVIGVGILVLAPLREP
jgi:signal peptidase II